jgi:hypothetical protein
MKKLALFIFLILQGDLLCNGYDNNLSVGIDAILGTQIKAEEIMLRFYYLKRLERSIYFFDTCLQRGLLKVPLEYEQQEKDLVIKGINFTQKNIISTIKQMTKKKSFKPLLNIWRRLISYKHIHDATIIKEFTALVIYILHTNAIDCGCQLSDPLRYNLRANHALTTMPLEEVLDILDLLVDELPEFFDRYELDSEMTWRSWAKTYGVITAVAGAALGLRIYLMYKKGIDGDTKSVETSGLPVLPNAAPSGGVPISLT